MSISLYFIWVVNAFKNPNCFFFEFIEKKNAQIVRNVFDFEKWLNQWQWQNIEPIDAGP